MLATILLYIVVHPLQIDHDCASYLVEAPRLLDGDIPYVDFVELNPPMAIYLNVIPAILARLLPIHIIFAFLLSVFSLILWSTWTIRKLIKFSSFSREDHVLGCLSVLYVLFSAILLFDNEFGQREHLFVLLYCPFLVTRFLRLQNEKISPPIAITAAVAAAIGACIKPHFVAIALLVELYWLITKRDHRKLFTPEMIVFAFVGLLYPLHALFVPEAMRTEFFGRWAPFVAKYYDTFNNPYAWIIERVPFFPFVLTASILAFAVPNKANGLAKMARPLGVFTLGALAIYLFQQKLWVYHLIPAVFGAGFILAVSLGTSLTHLEQKSSKRPTLWGITQTLTILAFTSAILRTFPRLLPKWADIALLAIIVCAATMLIINRSYVTRMIRQSASCCQPNVIRAVSLTLIAMIAVVIGWAPWVNPDPLQDNPVADVIAEYTEEGDPILVFSTALIDAYPLILQMSRGPGSRYLHQFQFAMLYKNIEATDADDFPYRTPDAATEEEARFMNELTEDVQDYKPRLILVRIDEHCQGCPDGFILMDYLNHYGFINTAMQHYEAMPQVGSFYVFVRRDNPQEV